MKHPLISVSLAFLVSNFCHAEQYQFEVVPTYIKGEYSTPSFDIDSEIKGISGEFYFNKVDDSKGPLVMAAFVDRASSLIAEYNTTAIDSGNINFDVDEYVLGGRYVSANRGWILGATFNRNEFDGDTDHAWDLSLGKYVAENTTLTFSYSDEGERE
ncbi:MAG: putative porin [Gammaproteobacteria bacterium]